MLWQPTCPCVRSLKIVISVRLQTPNNFISAYPIFIHFVTQIICEFILTLGRIEQHSSVTLTEVFPCFFLSCKANARVKLAKTGHGPHSSKLVVICVVLLLISCSMYCLCVNVYCTTATGCQPNYS